MNELMDKQTCPYCNDEVEEHHAEWEEGTHEVTCDSCGKAYAVETEYKFLGWRTEKICTGCGSVESECFCDDSDQTEQPSEAEADESGRLSPITRRIYSDSEI